MKTNYLALLSFFTLSGCASTEDKIVDLSGALFIIFILLFAAKSILPEIFKNVKFKLFYSSKIAPLLKHSHIAAIPIRIISLILIVYGFTADGLGRISIIIGFLLLFLASQIIKLSNEASIESQRNHIEKIQIIMTFLVATISLLALGKSMFNSF